MKERYEYPKMEIVQISAADVIFTSGEGPGGGCVTAEEYSNT